MLCPIITGQPVSWPPSEYQNCLEGSFESSGRDREGYRKVGEWSGKCLGRVSSVWEGPVRVLEESWEGSRRLQERYRKGPGRVQEVYRKDWDPKGSGLGGPGKGP